MVIRQAQRRVVVAQDIEDGVLVPAAMAEFEGIAIAARQHFDEPGKALAVRLAARGHIGANGAKLTRILHVTASRAVSTKRSVG